MSLWNWVSTVSPGGSGLAVRCCSRTGVVLRFPRGAAPKVFSVALGGDDALRCPFFVVAESNRRSSGLTGTAGCVGEDRLGGAGAEAELM